MSKKFKIIPCSRITADFTTRALNIINYWRWLAGDFPLAAKWKPGRELPIIRLSVFSFQQGKRSSGTAALEQHRNNLCISEAVETYEMAGWENLLTQVGFHQPVSFILSPWTSQFSYSQLGVPKRGNMGYFLWCTRVPSPGPRMSSGSFTPHLYLKSIWTDCRLMEATHVPPSSPYSNWKKNKSARFTSSQPFVDEALFRQVKAIGVDICIDRKSNRAHRRFVMHVTDS